MVELKPKGTSFNSLWSVVYCLVATGTQCYVSVQYISQYRAGLRGHGNLLYPTELDVVLGLTILTFVILPLFIISSVFRIGNYANDGFKLGRDHAICPKDGHLVDKIGSQVFQRLWKHFCPVSQTLHLMIAICLLLPETFLSSASVQQGYSTPDKLWSSDLDFLFSNQRSLNSDLILRQQNVTALKPNTTHIAADKYGAVISVAFLNFVFALLSFAVRYAAVFWYTNKTLSFLIALQLLFMNIDSLFTFSCATVLYKIGANFNIYDGYIAVLLKPHVTLSLYFVGEFVVFMSTVIVFEYGAHHFMTKFRLVDRKHNPDTYEKDAAIVRGPCNGYVTHTCAVVTLVLIACFRGPIYFDVVSFYRITDDSFLLACLIVGVCYMVFWVLFWTLLTVKQEWMFRILDYANVGEPIFVIRSTDNLSKSKSISIGSIDLKDLSKSTRKRPSSIPSVDITPSESGFDEGEVMPSSEDERFEISLPPVSEIPADNEDLSVIFRRQRNRRSAQRVTFHDPIRHSLGSLCDHNGSRCRSPFTLDNKMNVTADVHSMGRLGPKSQFFRRSSDPDMKQAMKRRQQNNIALATLKQNSLDARNAEYLANVNDLSTSSDDIRSNASEPLLTRRAERSRLMSPPDSRKPCVPEEENDINYKPSNITTAEQLQSNKRTPQTLPNDTAVKSTNERNSAAGSVTDITTKLNEKEYESFKGSKQPDIVPKEILNGNKIYPRPLIFIPKKTEANRRDSANFSMTSSQDTSSNDSDPVRQVALCSNV